MSFVQRSSRASNRRLSNVRQRRQQHLLDVKVRSRSATHSMMASLCVMAVGAVVYCICGFSWQGFTGRPAHVLTIAGTTWNWIAAEPLFLRGLRLDGGGVAGRLRPNLERNDAAQVVVDLHDIHDG